MTRIITFIIISVLALVAGLYFHWMATFLAVFLGIYVVRPTISTGILTGFASLLVVWFSLATFLDLRNDQLLSKQIGEVFGGLSGILLAILTGVIGGIGGALSGWLGASLRKK